MWLIVR
jgi:hypothetical protein